MPRMHPDGVIACRHESLMQLLEPGRDHGRNDYRVRRCGTR